MEPVGISAAITLGSGPEPFEEPRAYRGGGNLILKFKEGGFRIDLTLEFPAAAAPRRRRRQGRIARSKGLKTPPRLGSTVRA